MLHFIQDQLTMPATESMRVSIPLVAEIKFDAFWEKCNVSHWLLGQSSMYFIGCRDKVQCISLVAEIKFNVCHWLLR